MNYFFASLIYNIPPKFFMKPKFFAAFQIITNNMDSRNHERICNCKAGSPLTQTLAELDFERGLWYAGK